MKIALLILTIVSRILAFPFWSLLALVGCLILWIKQMIYFVRYGGEALVFSEKNECKKVNDIYWLVKEKFNESQKL